LYHLKKKIFFCELENFFIVQRTLVQKYFHVYGIID